MKKALYAILFAVIACFFIYSQGKAEYANRSVPQLEWITNGIPGLWAKPKEEIFRMMAMFPDFTCTDYDFQVTCVSTYNTKHNDDIHMTFFTEDYQEQHDNLWKVSITVDLQQGDQAQTLFNILWLEGMKPFHFADDDFGFLGAQPLYFKNDTTTMIAYFQPFDPDNNPYLLVEYLMGDLR